MYTTLQDKQTKITEATMEKICSPLSEKTKDQGKTEDEWQKKEIEVQGRQVASQGLGSTTIKNIP
ncbi:MAG: hypothetical protein D3925_17780 [Candidatus Electrothrix sp. AR5]|nr:hypothetical protein [Candidatus Electrothrix sp. AR5]